MATNPKAVELAKQGKVEYEWVRVHPSVKHLRRRVRRRYF